MLHIPSYNMGRTAGIAWKHTGNPHFHGCEIMPNTKEEAFIIEILNTAPDFFFPSSFFEGFYDSFEFPERKMN